MVKRILIGLFLIGISFSLFAQSSSFIIFKKVAVQDTIKLDSLSILPGSLQIFDGFLEIPASVYQINYAKAQLTWKTKPQTDSLDIQYRTLPLSLASKQFHKDPRLIEQQVIDNNPYIYSIGKEENAIFNLDGFNKSGSISRGIGFGNNQDLSVNSNLVLQLSGKLNNDIEILAAISDDNIPIQPEG